jgi:hypothetical protein
MDTQTQITKRRLVASIGANTYRALNVHAAQNDITLTDLVQRIFDEFLERSANKDNSSVS